MDGSERGGRDRFGLPLESPTILGETLAERRLREEAVRRLVLEVFEVTERHLGKIEARRIWAATPPKMKRGTKRSTFNPERDAFLLALYDAALQAGRVRRDAIPRHLGLMVVGEKSNLPLKPGWRVQSVEAVEKMIRLLVKKREAGRGCNSGPTLLGLAGDDFRKN